MNAREAFEAWMKKEMPHEPLEIIADSGVYRGGYVQTLWVGYQAGLASQAQQTESQWISVEERLPEVKVGSFEFYLVTTINLETKKQSVSEAAFLNEMELCNDDCDYELFSGWHSSKESKDYDGWYEPLRNEYCKVTHWMPLPPAPEEGA